MQHRNGRCLVVVLHIVGTCHALWSISKLMMWGFEAAPAGVGRMRTGIGMRASKRATRVRSALKISGFRLPGSPRAAPWLVEGPAVPPLFL